MRFAVLLLPPFDLGTKWSIVTLLRETRRLQIQQTPPVFDQTANLLFVLRQLDTTASP
jgi:hypothetical protein